MKKYLSLFFVLTMALFIYAQTVRAEAVTTSNTSVGIKMKALADFKIKRQLLEAEIKAKRQALQTEIKENKTELRTQIQAKRDEIKKAIEAWREQAKKKMQDLKAKIKLEKNTIKEKTEETRIVGREKALERFDAAILRMSNLKDRIKEQITKLDAKGVDTKSAENFVATAETKLDDVKAKIAEVSDLLSTSIDELSLENKTKLRTLAQEAQTLIVEAHQALRDAVKSLKEAIKIKMGTEDNNDNQ